MSKRVFIKNNAFYLTVFMGFIITALIFLLIGTVKLEEKLNNEILKVSTDDIKTISNNMAHNISSILKEKYGETDSNIKDKVLEDNILHQAIEVIISPILTKNIKYSYIVYKDERDIFRYLVDVSYIDKMELGQKFDADSKEWLEIYDIKKSITIKHKHIKELSISYLTPILYKDEVVFIFAIDFSIDKIIEIAAIVNLIQYGLFGTVFIMLLFIIFYILQLIKNYRVKQSTYIDALTSVYNRKYLEEFEKFVNLNNYVLCVLDIDRFKEVNDTYGHDVGDKVLRDVAKLIVKNYRINEDVLIRYGGEEFCLFLKKDRASQMSTLSVIDRLYNELKNTAFSVGHDKFIHITLSVGINMHPYESRNFHEAFKLADEALYLAKKSGRDRVIIYPDVEYMVENS